MKDNNVVITKQPTELALVEYARPSFYVVVKNDVPKEMLTMPDFWAHVSQRLKPGAHIEVVPQDRHYFAELFVLAAAKSWAKVKLLNFVELIADPTKKIEDDFTIEWADTAKWRVLKGEDVLVDDFDDRDEAVKWLKEHKEEMA